MMQLSVVADTQLVHQAWQRCISRIFPPLSADESTRLFHQFIRDPYTEPQRYYHNLQHLEEMLGYLAQYERGHGWHGKYAPALMMEQEGNSSKLPNVEPHSRNAVDAVQHNWVGTVLLLSILFHDVVYDPKRSDNEEKSAEFALDFLKTAEKQYMTSRRDMANVASEEQPSSLLWADAQAAQFVRETTSDYILKTKVHLSVEPAEQLRLSSPLTPSTIAKCHDDPLHVFLDLDLSILGQPDACAYRDRYAANIQREYSHYPQVDFLKGRSAFLSSFLNKPQWYKSAYFFFLLEAQARRNVAEELAELATQLKEVESAAVPPP
ncbi:hypothetical protein ABL78_5839 [Leptomonas seymouri]|uniref:Uncharacterized protein n=1 Tax=Leptomonas seymouri TaxID=5684 RepID=A0A0N1I496_LEPSE|nr:hypothetical protein ABL78_5839 [Leptomonas seymouri]|eukprot:KPI85114.1 hypothetical protein ABL78_5839 [Leptomonas seymouri]